MAKKARNSKSSTAKVVIGKPNKGINLLGSSLGLSGVRTKNRQHRVKPGALPGIEHIADAFTAPDSICINYIDYCANQLETGNVTGLDGFLAKPLLDQQYGVFYLAYHRDTILFLTQRLDWPKSAEIKVNTIY